MPIATQTQTPSVDLIAIARFLLESVRTTRLLWARARRCHRKVVLIMNLFVVAMEGLMIAYAMQRLLE
jgi:hypothetical protein